MNKEMKKKDKIILYLIATIALFSFILIFLNINSQNALTTLDNGVNYFSTQIQIPFFVTISKIISYLFDPVVFLFLFFIVISLLIKKKRKKEAFSLAILTILSVSLNQILKILIHRPRPLNSLIAESTFSFPSGHALISLIFFGALIFLFEHHIKNKVEKKFLTIIAALAVLIISLSRIYLNVHWLSDVLGSFALGIFIITCFALLVRRTTIFRN